MHRHFLTAQQGREGGEQGREGGEQGREGGETSHYHLTTVAMTTSHSDVPYLVYAQFRAWAILAMSPLEVALSHSVQAFSRLISSFSDTCTHTHTHTHNSHLYPIRPHRTVLSHQTSTLHCSADSHESAYGAEKAAESAAGCPGT